MGEDERPGDVMNDGEAPNDTTPAPADPLPERVGIPMMITRRQRAALSVLGVTDDEIRSMTPGEAHTRLSRAAVET